MRSQLSPTGPDDRFRREEPFVKTGQVLKARTISTSRAIPDN